MDKQIRSAFYGPFRAIFCLNFRFDRGQLVDEELLQLADTDAGQARTAHQEP